MRRRGHVESPVGPYPCLSARIARLTSGASPELLGERSGEGQELRREILRGSTIVAIGAGYPMKRFIYERAAELGVRLVLVDEGGHWAEKLVVEGVADRFCPVDLAALQTGLKAEQILRQIAALPYPVDAVCTFWEDCVSVTARVAEALGLPGNDPAAVDNARSKRLTRKASTEAGLPTPRFAAIDEEAELEAAAGHVGFPAIIKPEFGAEALGCYRVDSYEELVSAFRRIKPMINPETNPIFLQGTSMLLEQYLDGTEFDIDMLLCEGECVYANVAENWPTMEPYFIETGLHCPSSYPADRQAELVDFCIRSVTELGLTLGVFHVEWKYTSHGPQVLEVNARMGGSIVRDLNLFVRGVDLVEEHLLASAGIPIRPLEAPEPLCGISNVLLFAERTGAVGSNRFLADLEADPRVFWAATNLEPGDGVVCAADGFPTVLAEIGLRDVDAPTAVGEIKALADSIVIPYA